MANQVLNLWVDTRARKLVKSFTDDGPAPALSFVQGDTVTLVITLLQPNASRTITAPYVKTDVSGLTCKVGIGTPTATTGSGTPGIFQNSFTLDETNNTLTGELYITPSTVQTLLGSATSGTSTLEIEIYEDGNYTTAFSGPVTILAELIEAATDDPTPSDTYLTANEMAATYVKKVGAAGEMITLTSPSNTYQAILYVDDNGIFHADVTAV